MAWTMNFPLLVSFFIKFLKLFIVSSFSQISVSISGLCRTSGRGTMKVGVGSGKQRCYNDTRWPEGLG
ncbi:hypothetical protein AAHA92_30772 [Salvia divinorum]|uniref:Uncharacterized protein n=1 Tax=Salvia divinorum TaxID=28513 RepID=A0ABD1FRZ1_SALDI